MNRVETESKIQIYERNGDQITGGPEYLKIRSHWNHEDRIVLWLNGHDITVVVADLISAVKRCSQ